MNNICIAKKVSVNNVEFLDFALDDNERLLTFPNFKEASEFLKTEVGQGEELLNFIITTVEAQSEHPRMKELLAAAQNHPEPAPVQSASEDETPSDFRKNLEGMVEVMFLVECKDFDVVGREALLDKSSNKTLVPAIVLVDPQNPSVPLQTPNFRLKAVYIDKL